MSRASSLYRRGRFSRRAVASGLVVLAAGALAASAASGAVRAKQPAQIASLSVGYAQSPLPTIGTRPCTASQGIFLAQLGGELALHLTSDGVMHPWLVESYKRIGALGWTYHVRSGVKFWDGTPLTAADVAASWNWEGFGTTTGPGGAGPGNACPSTFSSFFKNVASIKATAKDHVLVTMKSPDATWRTVPAQYFMQIYEKKFLEAHTADFGMPGTLFEGTGPYIPSNFNPTSGVDFSANANYWNKAAYPVPFKKIHVTFFADEQSEALAARAGQIDLALEVDNPATFAATSGWHVTTAPTCGISVLSMPTQTAPFDDVHVRRAIAYAINRADIIKASGGGGVAPTNYMISTGLLQLFASPAAVAAALKSVPTYPNNLQKAKQELAQSAYPNGFTATIEANPNNINFEQVIKAQLAKIGITVNINSNSSSAWFGKILATPANTRPFTFIDTGGCQPDPSWEPHLFLGGAAINVADYHPAAVDALLASGTTDQKPADRLNDYVAINKAVNTDVPYVPLFLDGNSYSSKKYVWSGFGAYWGSEPWALFLKPTGK